MTESPRAVVVGTINAGATEIVADVTSLGSDVPVKVILSTDYAMVDPPGFPSRPQFTGTATPQYPHTIPSGSTISVLQCEASALVDADAAVYA